MNAKKPPVRLRGEVEYDEVHLVAGHNGIPEAAQKRGRKGDKRTREPSAAGAPSKRKSLQPLASFNDPDRLSFECSKT